jgi:hypothetical protein
MAEKQDQFRKDFRAFFEGTPCGEMMRQLSLPCAEMMSKMMPLCRMFMGKEAEHVEKKKEPPGSGQ